MDKNIIKQSFISTFGNPDVEIFAPGRANIIGEHTDYNDGFVLPFAISQGLWFFAKKNNSDKWNVHAHNINEKTSIQLKNKDEETGHGFGKYFAQVVLALKSSNVRGMDVTFGGDLPIGAGISSSSAITCGCIATINLLYDLQLTSEQMVALAVQAEIGSGVRGGIMDQYTIINGKKDTAILIDCKDNTHQYIDLNMQDHHFVLFNTNVKHNLIHTDYNNRRQECDKAVTLLNAHFRSIQSLRELQLSELYQLENMLPTTLFRRVNFVVQENNRVTKAVENIQTNSFDQLGILLYESHDGLSQMYDVSCDELDWLVQYTLDQDNILGARMMGGGFGGCTINLIKGPLTQSLIQDLSSKYFQTFGIQLDIISLTPENGIIKFL